ncbi:uncharacterized protein LOC131667136 [Phymastichus coffea]|uniref:uncharacterized protein LOC131667136 n=1 Tax=Phymastichus coffea TaxID=108790 RepID=UPI00273C322B|nr:uncharacterized protein LOC131667136 [Phymastichus coffea]
MTRRHAALAYLLVTFAECTRALGIGQSVTVPKTFAGSPAVAPELFRDGSFAFASVERGEDERDARLRPTVSVEIAGKRPAARAKCSLRLTPELGVVDVRVSSLRRASEDRVLLTVDEEFRAGQRKSTILWINVRGCSYGFAYADFLPSSHLVIASNNLVSRTKFRVFVADSGFCRASAWCSFTLPFDEGGLDASNVDLPWRGSRIESIEDMNVDFYAYHYRDEEATYKMILGPAQPPKYTKAELLSLRSAAYGEVASSQLSVCWTLRASLDRAVNCSKFNNYGRLMLNKTLAFSSPVTLLRVKNTKDGLLLFASRAECRTTRCSDVFVSQISENDKAPRATYRASKLDCPAGVGSVVFDAREASDRSIEIEYVCAGDAGLTFGDLSLTRSSEPAATARSLASNPRE